MSRSTVSRYGWPTRVEKTKATRHRNRIRTRRRRRGLPVTDRSAA